MIFNGEISKYSFFSKMILGLIILLGEKTFTKIVEDLSNF